MIAVTVLVFDGGLASSAAITQDVLATANRIAKSPRFAVSTCTAEVGMRLPPADLVIVPGFGRATPEEMTASLQTAEVRSAVAALAEAHAAGGAIAASCASTFLLAEAGLLTGRRATTTWWLAPLFRQLYPHIPLLADQVVVADWPIATAGAAMAQMDLMLAIVARFAGPELARGCASYLLLDERRSQSPYMSLTYLAGQDPKIAAAETWVRDNIERAFDMEELASAVALSPRSFARRTAAVCGLSPIQLVQKLRLERARHLLETTRLSVDQIALRIGYTEPSTLRRLMRRDTNRAPSYFRS